ncbi:hypothetical protein RRG08_037431 [Elysia crispata]|uniref:Uncharacterized protein n=1 Tax=Elysia crispata TaxID=231223 RepID=A0AAE1CSB0_9GAST|nr:hypothetical protein RRG08_037431 [Elysia crispata]
MEKNERRNKTDRQAKDESEIKTDIVRHRRRPVLLPAASLSTEVTSRTQPARGAPDKITNEIEAAVRGGTLLRTRQEVPAEFSCDEVSGRNEVNSCRRHGSHHVTCAVVRVNIRIQLTRGVSKTQIAKPKCSSLSANPTLCRLSHQWLLFHAFTATHAHVEMRVRLVRRVLTTHNTSMKHPTLCRLSHHWLLFTATHAHVEIRVRLVRRVLTTLNTSMKHPTLCRLSHQVPMTAPTSWSFDIFCYCLLHASRLSSVISAHQNLPDTRRP